MSDTVYPGADQSTPSLAQYFSWINHTNEGPTEKQTLANLRFFQWMHDEYGMQLDIYAFDAGVIDGAGFYGSTQSERFKRRFPNGFGPIVEVAAAFDCRLGIWGGPDGFGDTEAEAQERIETMVSLCRDHNFMLFKFDGVCGGLRPEKVHYFVKMMQACRKYCPDLILLNHRLELGEGLPHATTFLWEGAEMYSDVHMCNPHPGTHNRIGELSRGLPPDLQRLTEDHGVCISSCIDYWEDSLIQQAFNRCLILAPEIYGSPWLLRDDEFPRLARIYNLHRRYRDILVNGLVLPEDVYGKDAISRGSEKIRFLSLRNLTWDPITIPVALDASIGLTETDTVQVRRVHPMETILGDFNWGDTVDVIVDPFRACLVVVSSEAIPEIGFRGCDGEIIRDIPGKNAELKLWGLPGSTSKISLEADGYTTAELDGAENRALLNGDGATIAFDGVPIKQPWHRKLGDLKKTDVPEDVGTLYEATVFSADNNALEIRSLERSGPTTIPEVQNARDAFFDQGILKRRGIWDRYLFDSDPHTFFATNRVRGDVRVRRGSFRLDMGECVDVDHLVLHTRDEYNMQPIKNHEAVDAWVSADLRTWTPVKGFAENDIHFYLDHAVRYLKLGKCPDRINEVTGTFRGKPVVRDAWRANNLFAAFFPATAAWSTTIVVNEVYPGSYLVVPVFGPHVPEAVYAAARCDGEYLGATRRAPSYPANPFEGKVGSGHNYSYFIPLDERIAGKEIDVFLLGLEQCAKDDITSEVWLTAYPTPHVSRTVVLKRG